MGDPERLTGFAVSHRFLPTLGALPVIGRGFTAEEDRAGGPRVAVLDHGFWHRRFGATRR